MSTSSRRPRMPAKRLLALAVLPLLLLAAGWEPHSGHGLTVSSTEALLGFEVQRAGCQGHSGPHVEAAAAEKRVDPCGACAHALQSLGTPQGARGPAPANDPTPGHAAPLSFAAHRPLSPSSSRAPPRAS